MRRLAIACEYSHPRIRIACTRSALIGLLTSPQRRKCRLPGIVIHDAHRFALLERCVVMHGVHHMMDIRCTSPFQRSTSPIETTLLLCLIRASPSFPSLSSSTLLSSFFIMVKALAMEDSPSTVEYGILDAKRLFLGIYDDGDVDEVLVQKSMFVRFWMNNSLLITTHAIYVCLYTLFALGIIVYCRDQLEQDCSNKSARYPISYSEDSRSYCFTHILSQNSSTGA